MVAISSMNAYGYDAKPQHLHKFAIHIVIHTITKKHSFSQYLPIQFSNQNHTSMHMNAKP